MNRLRIRHYRWLAGLIATLCFAASSAAAQACTVSWTGNAGDGAWADAGNWSPETVPSTGDEVCITKPGTYTVTFAPYVPGSFRPPTGTDTVQSLTIGDPGGSGTQTLDISGQDFVAGGEVGNYVDVDVTGTTAVASDGAIVIDATGTGTNIGTLAGSMGGDAALDPGTLMNSGKITAQSEDSQWTPYIGGAINNTGTIAVASGILNSPTQNDGGTGGQNNFNITNTGTVSTAAGSKWQLTEPGSGAGASTFTESGAISNNGDIVLQNLGGGLTWNQNGGTIAGNPIQVQTGTVLDDSAGTGAFVFDYQDAGIQGTIPSGQTVTLSAHSGVSRMNETENDQQLDLDGKTLTNDGTLLLESTDQGPKVNSGDATGADATLIDGTLDNHGTVEAEVDTGSKWSIVLNATLTNEAGAKFSLDDGTMALGNVTNHGTFVLGPSAVYSMTSGVDFTNAADGTIVPEISSATQAGLFNIQGGCCSGPSAFTAGGKVTPTAVAGYTPAAGSEYTLVGLNGGTFNGTFGGFGTGWRADYSKKTASPAIIGYIYGGGAAAVKPSVGTVRASGSTLKVALSCPAGAACPKATVTETATVKKTTKNKGRKHTVSIKVAVGSCSATPAAGRTATATCRLNRHGAALLKTHHRLKVFVAITVGKTALSHRIVTLTASKASKKPVKKRSHVH